MPSDPRQPNGNDERPGFGSGVFTIRILSGSGLSLPFGEPLPAVIEKQLGRITQGSSPILTSEHIHNGRKWWLPYLVLEFDKHEIVVDALYGDISTPLWLYKAHFDVSRTSDISIAAYLRTSASTTGPKTHEIGDDLLVARVKFTPKVDAHDGEVQRYAATTGSGEFHLKIGFESRQETPLTIDAFGLLKAIGKDSYGKVMQVRKKDTRRMYALKTIHKSHIASRPVEVTDAHAEQTVLALVNNPYIVPLKFSFQNPEKLYLLMPFVGGKELFFHLQHHMEMEGTLDQARSRFYAAELLCALEHLHELDFVYGNLKPENVLLDYTGHIALCDFSLCTRSLCGSTHQNLSLEAPEYVALEILNDKAYDQSADWWTLGVILYEMMMGVPPFYDEDIDEMHRLILQGPINLLDDLWPDATSILTGLLDRDPSKRFGAQGAKDIRQHDFFELIDWNGLRSKNVQPPLKPNIKFDPYGVVDDDGSFPR